MLLDAVNLGKSLGTQILFKDVSFSLVAGEKIALIGRNGYGKSTLLKILSGEDHEYVGSITTKKGARITLTQQEHIHFGHMTPVEYILSVVPQYHEYKKVLEDYESGKTTNLNRYLEVLEYCTEHRYLHIEEAIKSTLIDFGISQATLHQPLAVLSGGQKRYVEMAKLMFSKSDIFLVDEPTNHMDYIGKSRFITWMKSVTQTVIVVTHDRDVLHCVDKVIELKNQNITTFKGNYDAYISQNALQTLTSVKQYQDQLNRLAEAKKKVDWGLQMRAKSKAWKTRYDQWLREYEKIKAATLKPSFWIDQTSVESMDKRVVDSYHKFKEKNIAVKMKSTTKSSIELLAVKNLSLGYVDPVCENVSFRLCEGERLFIKGRNGAGKSTLVKTIISLRKSQEPAAMILDGSIEFGPDVRIGEYQQEIDHRYLSLTLDDAIWQSYKEAGTLLEDKKVKSLMAQYLFDPIADGSKKIMNLSGGQKARFQLIKLLIGEPNLLILDEPTNHLDLPSIEELENALEAYHGGIIYISHDTYFIKKMGGDVIELGS